MRIFKLIVLRNELSSVASAIADIQDGSSDFPGGTFNLTQTGICLIIESEIRRSLSSCQNAKIKQSNKSPYEILSYIKRTSFVKSECFAEHFNQAIPKLCISQSTRIIGLQLFYHGSYKERHVWHH